jgi:hypothetical protein
MSKFIKHSLIIGGITALIYQGIRVFRMAKALMALQTPLEEYLTANYGEKPKLNCSMNANLVIDISVVAKFSAETLDKHLQIEEAIRDYITEYYPILCTKRLKVRVLDKTV